jgi:hypothetical protein
MINKIKQLLSIPYCKIKGHNHKFDPNKRFIDGKFGLLASMSDIHSCTRCGNLTLVSNIGKLHETWDHAEARLEKFMKDNPGVFDIKPVSKEVVE